MKDVMDKAALIAIVLFLTWAAIGCGYALAVWLVTELQHLTGA